MSLNEVLIVAGGLCLLFVGYKLVAWCRVRRRISVLVALNDWKEIRSVGSKAAGPLIGVLNHPDPEKRRRAAKLLGKLATRRSIAPLKHIKEHDADSSVQATAAKALITLEQTRRHRKNKKKNRDKTPNVNVAGEGRSPELLVDSDLRSTNTLRISELMANADGRSNLAMKNVELFNNCESWEKLAMAAIVSHRVSKLIHESIAGNSEQHIAADCLSRVANLIDGVPGYEDNVSLFRAAPDDLTSCDWVTVARQTALAWTKDVSDLLDAAKEMKR